MLYDKVSISLETYRNTVTGNNLGRPHVTLTNGAKWYAPGERPAADRQALDELHDAGLAEGGRIGAGFLETLSVLQRPGIEYYTFAAINGRNVTIRTAAVGEEAVLAIGVGGMVHLAPIAVEELAHELVWILPDAPAAELPPISCREADLHDLAAGLPVDDEDARLVASWLDQERFDGGELHVATQSGRRGKRARTSMGCGWLDTASGRLLSYRDGTGLLQLRGAGPTDLIGTLHQLADRLGEH